jgi:putative membrane protein
MKPFLAHWFTVTLSLWVAARLLPGVEVESWSWLLVAGLVLGFVNSIIRPIMVLLTLPITVLTLGLFYLVINGLALSLAAYVTPGFRVESFGWAVTGALVVGLVSWFVGSFVKQED